MAIRKTLIAAIGALIAVAAATASATVAEAKSDKVKAKIFQGSLVVAGSNSAESISLRLRGTNPGVLEIVVDGVLSEGFERTKFSRIVLDAGGGDDTVTIDESGGQFTTTTPTVLSGGA